MPCYLGDLSIELILCICDFLEPVDIASLALSNHSLKSVSEMYFQRFPNHDLFKGTSSFKLTEEYRLDFLKMMDLKIPHFHFCFDCLGLHQWEKIKNFKYPIFTSYNAEERTPEENQCIGGKEPADQRGPFYLPVPVQFRFAHLQLVMRWFQHGPQFGISPDYLRYTEVRETIGYLGLKTTRLMSVEARVMTRELENLKSEPILCLRVQELRYSPKVPWEDIQTLWPNEEHMILTLWNQRQLRLNSNNRPQERSRSKILNLELYEPMVWEETEFTKWYNLGSGVSPDVLPNLADPNYSLSRDLVILGGDVANLGGTHWRFGDPDPYTRFEGNVLKFGRRGDTKPVDTLACDNNNLLYDDRYKLVMDSIGPGHWVLQGEDNHRSAWQRYEKLFGAAH